MRPVFTIYVAAGVSLIFALISVASHGYVALSISRSIVEHNARGETRSEAEAQVNKAQDTMMLSICLAATQTIIILPPEKSVSKIKCLRSKRNSNWDTANEHPPCQA